MKKIYYTIILASFTNLLVSQVQINCLKKVVEQPNLSINNTVKVNSSITIDIEKKLITIIEKDGPRYFLGIKNSQLDINNIKTFKAQSLEDGVNFNVNYNELEKRIKLEELNQRGESKTSIIYYF